MKPITFTVHDGTLVPLGTDDVSLFAERFGEGELIETELRPIPSPGQKRFWAMMNAAYAANGSRWEDVEAMADALKIAVKYRRIGETTKGTPYFRGRSLADVRDWPSFLRAVHDVLTSELGIDPLLLAAPDDRSDDGRPDPTRDKPDGNDYSIEYVTPKECLDKFMAYAEDDASWGRNAKGKERLANVDQFEENWKEAMPQHTDFIAKCAQMCRSIITGKVPSRDARKLLQASMP